MPDDATGIVAGNQHWGHATSQDLYHWINQPIALYAINASSYIFSGSAVVDVNNTSGFFPNQDNGVVAIFTIATYAPIMLESQGLAYSFDGGYSFTMYSGNPVLDIGSDQFRDPKVVWYKDHWAMVVSYAQEFVIGIFTSPDLKDWTHASNFSRHGILGLQYECPNLVEVPVEGTGETMWLLQISINPGSPQGGSTSEYFLGQFDGFTFTPMDSVTHLNDFGKDAYAGQFFSGLPPTEAVSVAWASNWQYAQVVPTGELEGWRSSMGIPRSVAARKADRIGYTATSRPYDLSPVIGNRLASQSVVNSSFAVDFSSVYSNAVYLNVSVTNLPPLANITGGTLNFTFLSPISGEYLRAGFLFSGDNYFFIDRGGTRGFDNVFFTDKFATNNLFNGSWSMEATFDRSLFETFLDRGLLSSTTVLFPTEPLTLLSLGTSALPAGVAVQAEVYGLESGWRSQENENGTVLGNTTALAPLSSNSTGNETVYKRSHSRMVYEARLPW